MSVRRVLPALCFLLAAVLLLPTVWAGSQQPAPPPATPLFTPGSPEGHGAAPPEGSIHVPYDPSVRSDRLPAYPYNDLYPARIGALPAAARPAGPDLDVMYISRTPMYNRYEVWYTPELKPYLRPGSENDRRWPAAGEEVTFTAHFANKGTAPSGPFFFRWYLDGNEVAGNIHGGLAPGEQAETSFSLPWMHDLDGERLVGSHAIRFAIDPENAIAEPYELNNSLEDRTDAISLMLAVTPELYAALEMPVDPKWPFSAEDWLQKQIAAMNGAFARSVYPSVPRGITERVRLDKIVVSSTGPPIDWEADGGFYMSGDDRQGNPYYHPATDVSGALLHELAHQLGVIDLYNLGAEMLSHQLVDRNGQPVQIETGLSYGGLMLNPGIDPPIFEEHSAHALNANQGFRRGYYGEYLFDLPQTVRLRVLDNTGAPAPGVDVRLYQSGPGRDLYPTITDDIPEIVGTTDGAGLLVLPNRPVGDAVATHTRHTLRDNPFGVVDIIGERDEFIVELARGSHQEYAWLEITRLNLAAWHGEPAETTVEVESHMPEAGAPAPPEGLAGEIAFGQVALRWPSSPSPGIAGYNLYRTRFRPDFTYERILTGIPLQEYVDFYDYGQRAVTYAVTAVDAQGRESGFSSFFNAFSLVNPAAIAVDQSGGRIVLDPQNGYPVLYQSADGRWLDTLGSVHHHLEYSWYMARDGNGRLIFSHPGDWYSSRQSVKVANAANDPLFEFGTEGSGPGQFVNPTGVAAWGGACTIEGPYATDAHTLLLLHFDGSYDGVGGEAGEPNGTSFTAGRHGQALLVDGGDTLTYETANNLNREQGAIEFWVRPNWDGGDEQDYNFLEVGQGWFNRIRITKDGANNLRLMVWDDSREYGVAYNVGHWRAGEWHHVAATWTPAELALYVDGELRDLATGTQPPQSLASRLFIGTDSGGGYPAQATIEEFRISDVPRVGNSDTCGRILVADSGNDRIQAFDALGGFLSTYGSTGSGPGQFRSPQGLAVDDRGRVIAADSGNHRLQLLSFDGRSFGYLRSIDGLNWPTGVWAYGSDRILVAETGDNTIKELIPEGDTYVVKEHPAQQVPYNAPRGVAADGNGNLIVADTGNRRVVTLPGALPTFSPTPTPTPPTPVPACTEHVINTGFEENVIWEFPITASRAGYTTVEAHTGARSARLGVLPRVKDVTGLERPARSERNLLGELAPDNASFSAIYQTIRVRADAGSATLTFWYRPGSEAQAGDYQRVMLLNPDGYTYIATLMQVLEKSPDWRKATFDLTPFRGQSLVLYFEVYNDNISAGPRTWMYLDDVSVQTCGATPPTASPPPSATPSPGDDLTLTGLVYDAAAGPWKSIPDAEVSVIMCVPRSFTAHSGLDGRYSLFLPASYLDACLQVTLEAAAAGYRSYSQLVSVSDLRAHPERDLGLSPLPRHWLPLVIRGG